MGVVATGTGLFFGIGCFVMIVTYLMQGKDADKGYECDGPARMPACSSSFARSSSRLTATLIGLTTVCTWLL